MSKWIVDIHGDIEGDYEIIEEYKEPETGQWKAKTFHELFCDNCGFDFDIMRNDFIDKMNYCPNCGCRMGGLQESGGLKHE